MVKFKTKTAKEIFDKRGKSIGEHVIRFIVNDIHASSAGVTASGFYYYEENDVQIVLDAFATILNWENVELVESSLPVFSNSQNLKDAFVQRIREFSFLQQQAESGENYGTIATDWEIDQDESN